MREYKLNKKLTFKYFYNILFKIIGYLLIGFVGLIIYKDIINILRIIKIFSVVLIMWSILYLIPLLLLYFNHRNKSKSTVLIIDNQKKQFTYSSSNKILKFVIKDIKKIELFLTPTAYDKRIDWLFFGKYHYSKIFIKNGDIIKISCLVCDDINDIFPSELIIRKKKFIPTL